MKVRIKFSKTGVIKYIGHLDLMRYFQKAFRRTDYKVKYSGGFSPHMIMSFAQALGVGVESHGEYFDVELEDGQDLTDLVKDLNVQMVDGIRVLGAKVLPETAGNAMASVAASDYNIIFDRENPITDEIIAAYEDALEIPYTKTTKTGDTTFNIKEFVFALKKIEGGVNFVIAASSSGNIRTQYILEVLAELGHFSLEDHPYHVFRNDLYLRNNKGDLVPLDQMDE